MSLKRKMLAATMIAVTIVFFTVGLAYAQGNTVTGSISASSITIVVHSSVTLTCTYTSSAGIQGTGSLQMGGPKASSSDHFSLAEISWWDSINSGVPVTFTQQLDSTGYYKFRWSCSGGGVDGVYTEVIVHVVDAPSVLPEAPPVAGLAIGFAAVGLFAVVAKKKSPKTNF